MRFCWIFVGVLAFAGGGFGQSLSEKKTYPRFAVGPTGIFATIEPGNLVTVQEVAEGTPAAATKLAAGDVLVMAGGAPLDVVDPRVVLGEAIGAAEGGDGKLVFRARRGEGEGEVVVTLPVLGAYAATWPERCGKSAGIVAATAAYVAASQEEDGSYRFGEEKPVRDELRGSLAGLFLLSTGDEEYMAHVKRHVEALVASVERGATTNNWHLGYQGILLGEYYLKTGEKKVLPALQALCDRAVAQQAAGGWGHWGNPGPGYVQSGLMSSAGVPVLTTLIIGRECGVEIDDEAYVRAVKFMYRMVGHGCVPYGDHRSELWWSNTNGRNAKLACGFALLGEPRFQRAAEHLATVVTDSYFQPEFGHTGGGFNVIWRGMAAVHVPEGRRANYARQMAKLAWYYDLCRQPGGGFSILPTPPDNGRYSGLGWGTGAIGLTYTAPLRTLRITGAPRTRFSAAPEVVDFEWGTEADGWFLSSKDADGFGGEVAEPHEIYEKLLGKEKGSVSVAFCAKHLRHFSPLVRSWAARRLGELGSGDAIDALASAAGHADPRVRRAVFDGVSGYDNWSRPMRGKMARGVVSEKFVGAIEKTLGDAGSAWWEIDGALFALGHAEAEDIRRLMPVIERFAAHDEWYLRESAFWAIAGLKELITGEEFNKLAEIYGRSEHVYARSSYDGGFRMVVRSKPAGIGEEERAAALRILGKTTHDVPVALGYGEAGIHEATHRTMMIFKHFGPEVYEMIVDDLVTYLGIWEPYHQHSVWLITGSKWQLGILKVLEGLGEKGRPVVVALKDVLGRYGEFDAKRAGKNAVTLEEAMREAVEAWEVEFGKA